MARAETRHTTARGIRIAIGTRSGLESGGAVESRWSPRPTCSISPASRRVYRVRGESQGASPARFEACLRVWRTLAGLLRLLSRLWRIEPTDDVHDIRVFYPVGFFNKPCRVLEADAGLYARRSREHRKRPTPTAHPRVYFWYVNSTSLHENICSVFKEIAGYPWFGTRRSRYG